MAAKFTYPHPNGSGDTSWDVEEDLDAVTEAVNEALQTKEKFVSFKTADGKKRSFIAAEISSIWEE